MSELVLSIGAAQESRTHTISRDTLLLASVLILCQLLDGVLTGIGVRTYGIEAEGNVLLRTLMEWWGAGFALFLAKSVAILVVFVLVRLSPQVPWVPTALRCIIVLYACAAIIPWTVIHTRYFFL